MSTVSNSVNSVNSVNSYSAVLPPSPMEFFVCEMKNAPKDQIFRSGSPLIKCVKDQRKEEDDKCEEETATPRESLAVSSERSLPVTPFIRRPLASIAL